MVSYSGDETRATSYLARLIMIISSPIDPPPAYRSVVGYSPAQSASSPLRQPGKGILSLPLGIQLEILQLTLKFRVSAEGDEEAEKARRVYNLLVNVRATCRAFYLGEPAQGFWAARRAF